MIVASGCDSDVYSRLRPSSFCRFLSSRAVGVFEFWSDGELLVRGFVLLNH